MLWPSLGLQISAIPKISLGELCWFFMLVICITDLNVVNFFTMFPTSAER